MKDKRPINFALTKFKFPVMAVVSIFHRISGMVLFLFIPFLLYALRQSLTSQTNFYQLQQCLSHPLAKFTLWVFLGALVYHVSAGIRHLLMDMGFAETRQGGRYTAYTVLTFVALVMILLGAWLW